MNRSSSACVAIALVLAAVAAWAVAPASAETRVQGEILRVEGHRMWMRADTGQQVEVDISGVEASKRHLLAQPGAVGHAVTVVGDEARGPAERPSFVKAKDVVGGMQGQAPSPAAGGEARVRGEVLKVDGTSMWLKAKTGQQVQVDISQIPADRRDDLEQGDDVVVVGQATLGDPDRPSQLQAREIRDEDGAGAGRRDRLRGSVVRVEGDRMWMVAEAGQQVEVDLSRVLEGRRRQLAQGDEVIVVGEARGPSDRPNRFEARKLRRVREASAAPRSR